jgi:RND family efflux transporter MFP subunit
MTKRLAIVPLLVWLAGCGDVPVRTEASAYKAPVAVRTVTVGVEELPTTFEATGTVRARTLVSVASRLMGYVREVKVQTGDRVKEGQLLIALDARDLDAAVRRSEAARGEVKSAIPEAESGVSAAKTDLDLAQVTFQRMQELYNKRSISNQEFDEASAHLKSAQPGYEMARAKRTQLDDKLAQAEQEVRAAQLNYGYTRISASFDGMVTSKSVEPGNLAMPGAPLLTIEREGAYRLEALVDESRLPAIRVGQVVTVKLDGVEKALAGRVSEIVPEVDAATRAGIVKIDLPATAGLKSGTFGRALFGSFAMRRAIMIPSAAVTEHGQLQAVLVAERGTARTRLVTLGTTVNDRTEVLSGLNEGDTVITSVPQGLGEGSRVEILR